MQRVWKEIYSVFEVDLTYGQKNKLKPDAGKHLKPLRYVKYQLYVHFSS